MCVGYAGIIVAGEDVVGLHDILGPIVCTLYEVILNILHKTPVIVLVQSPKASRGLVPYIDDLQGSYLLVPQWNIQICHLLINQNLAHQYRFRSKVSPVVFKNVYCVLIFIEKYSLGWYRDWNIPQSCPSDFWRTHYLYTCFFKWQYIPRSTAIKYIQSNWFFILSYYLSSYRLAMVMLDVWTSRSNNAFVMLSSRSPFIFMYTSVSHFHMDLSRSSEQCGNFSGIYMLNFFLILMIHQILPPRS